MLLRNMDASFRSLLADPFGAASQLLAHGFNGAAPLAAALVVMLLAGGVWLWRRPAGKGRTNVSPRRAFSQAEGLLWSRLNSALPEHVVLMGVPITRFVSVRRSGGLGSNQRRLEALTVDFGIFRSDGTVSSIVILEDGDGMLSRRQLKLRRKLLDRADHRGPCFHRDRTDADDGVDAGCCARTGASESRAFARHVHRAVRRDVVATRA